MFLDTTALKEFWDSYDQIALLGPWCVRFDDPEWLEGLKTRRLPNVWDDRAELARAADRCRRAHDGLLAVLVECLNALHGVAFGERYWRIVIGPWLFYHVQQLYDRRRSLDVAYDAYPDLALPEGDYDVDLRTVHAPGAMQVCDYLLRGESAETVILNGHDCHAGQANDDIAGVVAALEAMKRLSRRKNYYSYRLIVAPEHFGTVFYLAHVRPKVLKTFKCGMFLEMLGSDTPLALQESFTGASELDRAARHFLAHKHPAARVDRFRKIVGNDETVWEAPGYEVPTISLSRFPYPEYHTSLDTDAIIREERLEESVEAILGIIDILETNHRFERRFTGLVALSNPKYDLYIGTEDPSIPVRVGEEQRRWNYLMDCLPRYFDGRTTVLDIAEKHGIPHALVYRYIQRFEEKGLVRRVARKPAPAPAGFRAKAVLRGRGPRPRPRRLRKSLGAAGTLGLRPRPRRRALAAAGRS